MKEIATMPRIARQSSNPHFLRLTPLSMTGIAYCMMQQPPPVTCPEYTGERFMQYRRFGRTELQIPVISTGGMRYQDGWKDKPLAEVNQEVQKNLEATIAHSIANGINHIETARGYGASERQLGLVLPTYPRDQLIVQTKIGPNDSPEEFTSQFEESLERLQLDHVDLLAIHGINDSETLEKSIRPGGCFEAAQKLRQQGKCRFVGFSTHGPVDVILAAIRHGEPRVGEGFDYVNLHWYYINQLNWPCIEEATARDMGVFIISPSDKGGKLYAPSDKLVKLCEPLHPIVFNDLFCLSRPQVHTLSLGSSRPSDYDEHLEAVALMPRTAELLPEIEARLERAMIEAVGEPLQSIWEAGLPRWEEAPGGINIPVILWLDRLVQGYDMIEYGKMRYNMLGNGGHWFPGYKVEPLLNGDVTDTQIIESCQASGCAFAEKIPTMLRAAHNRMGGEEVKRLSQSE